MKEKLKLEEIQKISLEILKKIDEVCNFLNIDYSLAYGTLIGAIRHNGFIPWDDDIDIWMSQNDYYKFINYFKQNKAKLSPLEMYNPDIQENYPYLITRISDSKYVLDVLNENKYGMGVFVDIYPLFGLGNNVEEAKKLIKEGKKNSSLVFLSTRKYIHKGNTKSLLKLLIKPFVFIYAKIIGKKVFAIRTKKLSKMYLYNDSGYVGCVVWPTYNENEIFKKEWFNRYIYVEFEGYRFKAVAEYDKILKQIYGDYLTLPDIKDRQPHHLYDAYVRSDI